MKVLIVGPNLGMGGVERASSNYANLLAQKGVEVTYLAIVPGNSFFQLHPSVHYVEPLMHNKNKLDLFRSLKHLRRTVVELRPEAILAFTKLFAALANTALFFSPYKVIILERSSPLYVWPARIEWLTRVSFSLKKCVGVIAQTSLAAEYQKRYYRTNRVLVLPNPIRPIMPSSNLRKEKWILLVGRLNDECKGFDRFMQVLNRLQFPDQDWKVVFAGGDLSEADYLLNEIKEPEKKARIEFLGRLKNMDDIYGKSSIFVIPSRSEGFPNALCEAMAAGLPSVSFDFVAGPRDLIEDGINGYLVEDGNISEMANKLELLMTNQDEREKLGIKASEIGQRLSYAQTAKKLVNFLETL